MVRGEAGNIGRMPQAELARISSEKITGYLLNPSHPYGGSKARFFIARGFSPTRPEELAEALRRHAVDHAAIGPLPRVHGSMYEVVGRMGCPDGRGALVRSVWIVEPDVVGPRLITAYPAS